MENNRRIKVTKQLLLDALIDLLQEKSIENISIRELTSYADINRSTFYSHYNTIYDLLDNLTEQYMSKVVFHSQQHDLLMREQIEILEYMKLHKKAYLALIKTDKFLEYLINKSLTLFDNNQLSYRMLKKECKDAYEMLVQYSCAGSVQILYLFLENRLQLSAPELAKLLYDVEESIYKVLIHYQNNII